MTSGADGKEGEESDMSAVCTGSSDDDEGRPQDLTNVHHDIS